MFGLWFTLWFIKNFPGVTRLFGLLIIAFVVYSCARA